MKNQRKTSARVEANTPATSCLSSTNQRKAQAGWVPSMVTTVEPGEKPASIVEFSDDAIPEDTEKARLLGAEDYVLKPSIPRNLIDFVKALHTRWLSVV